jgi:hypothetical protein
MPNYRIGRVDANLQPVTSALAAISEPELHSLIDETKGVPQVAPGLLAWLEAACNWELNARVGLNYPLPEAAIPPEEDAVSIDAAIAMRATFSEDSAAVRALFDALVDLLTGGERKH